MAAFDRQAWASAQQQAQASLARHVLGPRVSQSQFSEACGDALAVLNLLDSGGRDGVDQLKAVLDAADAQRDFIIRLNGLLHANRPIQDRFESFAAWLVEHELFDWWLVSLFPALVFPDRFAVLDPLRWQSPEAPVLPAQPDWDAYRLAQQAAHVERKRRGEAADLLEVHRIWLGEDGVH
ncbi:MAG: hypothetical protein ACXIUL_00270 [Wenzhouxiangella sp.]